MTDSADFDKAYPRIDVERLRAALTASWDRDTAYLKVHQDGNPALGQCYPTARVVQWFFPEFEIARGEVWTGAGLETHFWNARKVREEIEHLDLSWSQFPPGSRVVSFELLDRTDLGDSPPTVTRCELLLHRVLASLAGSQGRSGVSDPKNCA